MKILNQNKCMNNIEELKWDTFKKYFDNMKSGGCYEPYEIYHVEGTNKFLETCNYGEKYSIAWYAVHTIDELISYWKNDIINDYESGYVSDEDVAKMGIVLS